MRMFKILGSRRQPAQKKPTQEKRLKEEASNEHAGSTALLDDPSFQGKKDRVVNCIFHAKCRWFIIDAGLPGSQAQGGRREVCSWRKS